MGNSLLAIGRAFGSENLTELQKLRRLANSNKTGRASANFVFDHNQTLDSVTLMDKKDSKKISLLRTLLGKFFPQSSSKDSKTFVDVIMNKFGKEKYSKEGILTIQTKTKNSNNSISNITETRVASNPAGVIVDFVAKGESNTGSNLFIHTSNNAPQSPLSDIVNKIRYSESNGLSRLSVNYSGQGNIKTMNGEVRGPKEFMDSIIKILTDGEFSSLSDMLKATKNEIGRLEK